MPHQRALGIMPWLVDALLDRLFPEACVTCGDDSEAAPWVCPACLSTCPDAPLPLCAACGHSADTDARAHDGPLVYAATRYGHGGDTAGAAAVRFLKFEGRHRLARPLAALLLARVRLPPGTLIPVPLHPSRCRQRGFDQARLLATHLAALSARPLVLDALRRVRVTAPQSRLAREARLLNTRQAFVVMRALPEATPIVLVDDVVTTGATIRACALALRRAGAREVSAIVVARALRLEAGPRTG